MAEYYFMSQLPSLDGIGEQMALPIAEERFQELCHRFLGKKAQKEIENLTLIPSRSPEKSSSALVEAWNEGERNLRLALGKVRADKLKKSFDWENGYLPSELIKVARMAVEMESPMEAEKFLNQYRMDFLESLRPMDTFCEDSVFYYGLKLKLMMRIRQFDEALGEAAYKEIYNSIMNGDRLEGLQ
ncbi:MAG: DUF2764 family protein [Firmicutes bacterium]|nr:DUF2764 family protein [Bacillota bacterium]MBQ2271388.1 DUF2764 family protein [Bacillota bacterium]MBQ5797633.1 DUF2764 family protein [Bacillota bacterium]MBR5001207.1 DUF2764 family protein [Bacillota bacterium]MBR6501261.1 DUF2764 family protein [Bacillota bacterium]